MKIKNLTFTFDKKQKIFFFKDMSVEFASNQIHFIQGKNGVGKSTLFNILQGKFPTDGFIEGSVEINGTVYKAHKNGFDQVFISHVKTVQQNYASMLADQFTFIENLQLAALPQYPSLRPLPEIHNLPDFLNEIGIDINKPVYLLSGGQKQILAILMAMQKPTKLLLLDEPFAALDEKNAGLVMEFLNYLISQSPSLTILMISHDSDLIKKYAKEGPYIIEQESDEHRIIKSPAE
jgi:ABC-type lipoprotein export system ATPase subunit